MNRLFFILIMIFLLFQTSCQEETAKPLRIGSKKFTESVILGEIVNQLGQSQNLQTEYKSELGGTRVLWNALLNGEIDIYPEYSGTILNEILKNQNFTSFEQAQKYMDSLGIRAIGPLGFNNTYALGITQKTSQQTNISCISDLKQYPELKFGFTNEFLDRGDGWVALQQFYNLPQKDVRGLDHDLAYKALESGAIDLMDLYSTDAEIDYYNLIVLHDDLKHFPEYKAWLLVRKDILESNSEFENQLLKLSGIINEEEMIDMSARAKIKKEDVAIIAEDFLHNKLNLSINVVEENWLDRLMQNTKDHLLLVLISLFSAIIIAIPLGIIATRNQQIGKIILSITGIIQTIPSLAILVFMIPLLGIGAYPAMMALFLYSLLPIVRNTHSGIKDIPTPLRESAIALGLKDWERLRFVELPLALRSILSGIKTAAVINVGTATLGALIGAGGYGQPILTGIRLDDTGLILEGAVPAALLALLVQGAFDFIEKRLVKH